ncbi:MAG: 50S ribosomal protein L11 methyltransferase [Thermomicrobiales bacterium]|nr:50S ribosomal protein L11 methyltransferase [Thermomicrobiales bacterium]
MSESTQRWVEVTVPANAESVESVCELLSTFGYNEGVVIEEPYKQDDDGDNLEIDPTRPVLVRTWLPVDERTEQQKDALTRAIWHFQQIGGVGEPTFAEREEEDWANAWKEHFQILRIGKSFVVRPTWREYEPREGDRVIHLDPGMAFGTGLHPSTEMCMLFAEEVDLDGLAVLDIGAGSGILAIGALRAGAASAVAVEIDPVAARALAENVRLNDMEDRISVVAAPIDQAWLGDVTFPIVFGNLIARILADNAASIAQHVAPGGLLIASGIIEEREQLVVDAFEPLGITVKARKQAGDWVALLLERR